MKRVYWRPARVPRTAMLLISALAVGVLVAVELLPVERIQSWYEQKLEAAHLARQAMGAIKSERMRLRIMPDPEADPAGSGMIGFPLSAVTSNTGYLNAKQVAVNPNFAAVMVSLLKQAGVESGDTVAVSLSGSFPSLNIAAFAAIQTLALRPVTISSAAASEWGANHPQLLWIDMERVLYEQGIFKFRSIAASRGGIDDRGFGMSKQGLALIDSAIERNQLLRITPDSLAEAVDRRMEIYQEQALRRPVKAYINVGGGSAAVGTYVGKKQFRPGLNLDPPRSAGAIDSVMMRFAERDVPVIHIYNVVQLAKRYGLNLQPRKVPRPGEGNVFVKAEYNRWLAAGGLVLILAVMLAFIRMDVGMRILKGGQRPRESSRPQPMV